MHFLLSPQRESGISMLHLHSEIFQKVKLKTVTPLVMSHGNIDFERFVFLPCLKVACGYDYFLLAINIVLVFCSNWKYVCVFNINVIVGKEPTLPIFFTAGIFSLAGSGKPLLKRKFHSSTYMYTHTHTHIWMSAYFALNSGYIKYSCGTCPGQAWSIKLGLYVTRTLLLWNKPSFSKYF